MHFASEPWSKGTLHYVARILLLLLLYDIHFHPLLRTLVTKIRWRTSFGGCLTLFLVSCFRV